MLIKFLETLQMKRKSMDAITLVFKEDYFNHLQGYNIRNITIP
jgi:hypothetical protein